jgi:aspartyl-tRNA(Asn)/glutamyl-tRNA(Gln) amidotransferase subunit C
MAHGAESVGALTWQRMADPSARARELAALAHLELTADEAATFGAQLETVLGYLRRLQAVDVADTPEYLPAEHPCSGLREDEVAPSVSTVLGRPWPSFSADRALAGAPALRERSIAVPKFMHGRAPG